MCGKFSFHVMVDRELFTYVKNKKQLILIVNKKFKVVNGAVWSKLTNLFNTLIVWDNYLESMFHLRRNQVVDLHKQKLKLSQSEVLSKGAGCRSFSYFLLQVFLSHFCYTPIFNYKQLGSGLSPQSCSYFQGVFLAQSCLMVAQQFDQVIDVCEEYSDFRIQNRHL